jgi:hypothetical protein
MRCTRKSYGEQLLVLCPAGITAADLYAARAVIAGACFATDVQVIAHPTRRHLVAVTVIRRHKELNMARTQSVSGKLIGNGVFSRILSNYDCG